MAFEREIKFSLPEWIFSKTTVEYIRQPAEEVDTYSSDVKTIHFCDSQRVLLWVLLQAVATGKKNSQQEIA